MNLDFEPVSTTLRDRYTSFVSQLKAGLVTAGVGSYLTVKLAWDKSTGPYVPFVVAFGVLGLAMSVLIIGVVVSGAVGAATRRIGILKALGASAIQLIALLSIVKLGTF